MLIGGIHCCDRCKKSLDGEYTKYKGYYYCSHCYFVKLKEKIK